MKYSFFHFQITKNCNCQLTFLKKLFTSKQQNFLPTILSSHRLSFNDEIDQLNYLYSIDLLFRFLKLFLVLHHGVFHFIFT